MSRCLILGDLCVPECVGNFCLRQQSEQSVSSTQELTSEAPCLVSKSNATPSTPGVVAGAPSRAPYTFKRGDALFWTNLARQYEICILRIPCECDEEGCAHPFYVAYFPDFRLSETAYEDTPFAAMDKAYEMLADALQWMETIPEIPPHPTPSVDVIWALLHKEGALDYENVQAMDRGCLDAIFSGDYLDALLACAKAGITPNALLAYANLGASEGLGFDDGSEGKERLEKRTAMICGGPTWPSIKDLEKSGSAIVGDGEQS